MNPGSKDAWILYFSVIHPDQLQVEVLILINAPADAPEAILEQNRATMQCCMKDGSGYIPILH